VALATDAVELSSRAALPVESGFAELGGVRVAYDVYGAGDETILFFVPWAIVHSRFWKLQVPYLSRHFRVVTFDPRGNGRSDRPSLADEYGPKITADHALAVLDETGTADCVLVSHCGSAPASLLLATEHPERIRGAVFMSPALPLTPALPERAGISFDDELDTDEGWAKQNRHYWARDYPGYLAFFFDRCFSEPHSTKQIEDCIAWGRETDAETLALTVDVPDLDPPQVEELLGRLRGPLLVTQGDEDGVIPPDRGQAFADATGAELVSLTGAGHCPNARHPVRFNLLLREFAERVYGRTPPRVAWRRALRRTKRALYVSSPIGLGHARRDLAIADELRRLRPGLEVDWLAQHPVTAVLEARGERIHPASAELANESTHIERESAEHDLHVFQAIRRMDEIFLSNFMVFLDVVREEPYDLWIGDEAWELDYFLHENPELKSAAYVWLTDFVGWLPMPDGGGHEEYLTADLNAEMIEQVARFPRVRDRAIFVGDPEDVVAERFGPGLPSIREWTERNFDFAGYVAGFDPGPLDRDGIRRELGWDDGEQVCIVTVGGSGVGSHLLARVIEALPAARARVPRLRMEVVAGPRIDTASLPEEDGLTVHAYVGDLPHRLAACDLAVVHGGLTTTMELTASRTPFLYFPLAHHFEQNFHVRHRLERYGAGRRMDYETSGPEEIAAAIAEEIGRNVDYLPVDTGGASRVAALIAELV
jgi:pimeloyl-ACP methyl ester carboxylesterase/predicted glycosyltransferase